MTLRLAHEPTSLYRFYDAASTLLYIGITARGRGRWHNHAADKPWWPAVTTATIEHHPNRAAALAAERAAIIAEKPLHNTHHNRCPKRSISPTWANDVESATSLRPDMVTETFWLLRTAGGKIMIDLEGDHVDLWWEYFRAPFSAEGAMRTWMLNHHEYTRSLTDQWVAATRSSGCRHDLSFGGGKTILDFPVPADCVVDGIVALLSIEAVAYPASVAA